MSCAGPPASPVVDLGEVRVWCGRRLCNLSDAWMLTRKGGGCLQVSLENALGVTVPSLTTKASNLPGCVRSSVAGTSGVVILSSQILRDI